MDIHAVDLFCGVGGLTCGLQQAGINVVAGVDIDQSSKYAFERNNNALFIHKSVEDLTADEINSLYPDDSIKVLMGCAPCQPFSTYSHRYKKDSKDEKWGLLYSFSSLINEVQPHIVSMENVPSIIKEEVFHDFVKSLEDAGYFINWKIIYCPDYGIPQNRKRLVLLASRVGEIKIQPPSFSKEEYLTVKDVIGNLPSIKAGGKNTDDSLHISRRLSDLNMERIKQSKPGGTWRDWEEKLILECHKKESGRTYSSVYGRMEWNKQAPTITTQFYGYGNGRFGHPEQNRALSLREGALIQTFPLEYEFVEPGTDPSFTKIGIQIGNAVPVNLGKVVGDSILHHLRAGEHIGEE